MKRAKVVILGGGPSGLGVAWGLSDAGSCEVRLVEKQRQLGGLSGSFQWESATLDFGPHRFSPEFPELVLFFKKLLGDDFLRVKNDHAVIFRERTYQYPPRVKDFLNLNSLHFSSQVLASLFWQKMSSPASKDTFEGRLKKSFGAALFREVVHPLSHKVWGDPATLHPEFAEIRFSVPTVKQWAMKWLRLAKTNQDEFFYYPRKGFQQLWDALAIELERRSVAIHTQSELVAVETTNNRVTAVKMGEEWISCDYLVSTIPLEDLLLLLENRTHSFESRGMLLVNFLLDRPRALPARVVIFPESRYVFNRLCEPSQFSPDVVPKGTTIIQADVTRELDRFSEAEWVSVVQEQLVDLKILKKNEKVKTQVLRLPIAYPIPSLSREKLQREWNATMKWKNVISTGRFASSDYNNSHTALFKGKELARFILEGQSPAEWYGYAESLRKLPVRD